MNELDLPPRRPLPDETRERVLRTVLDGIDAPRRRRTAPLAAAAVVVVVLGAATAVALTRTAGPGELGGPPPPAVATSTVAPTPDGDTPAQGTGTAYADPLARCRAAVVSSGRAADYPDVDGWAVTETLQTRDGIDAVLAVDDAFLCYVSPTTVTVTRTAGVPVGGVDVVDVGPGLFALLNPDGASVSWTIGGKSSEPSTAAVQAVELLGGTEPADVQLTVAAAGSTGPALVEPLPGAVPDPIVVVDRSLLPRFGTTADGTALDECAGLQQQDPRDPGLSRTVTGQSEFYLWQPLSRFNLRNGDFVITATIDEAFAGMCVRSGEYRHWWSREFRSAELPAVGSIQLSTIAPTGEPVRGGLFGLGEDVARVELTRADGVDVPCRIGWRLALCLGDDASGPLTLTLFDTAGGAVQQAVSLEDI